MPQILIFFCKPWPAALAEKSLLQMLLRIELSWEKVLIRSSHRRCSIKEGVLRNFSKFTGKHLCQSLFFNKVAGSCRHEATLLKKRFWHAYFPVNFEKFLRRPSFIEHRVTASDSLPSILSIFHIRAKRSCFRIIIMLSFYIVLVDIILILLK